MAAECTHFAHLRERFEELCRKFLDDGIAEEMADPAAFMPDLDAIAAFRLLFHAEVETFLEAKALEKVGSVQAAIAGSTWQRSNPNLLSLYLLARNFLQIEGEGELTDSDLRKHFSEVMGTVRARVKKNNGIKSESFIFLSVAAGKALDEIDVTLSSTLNSYGRGRGDVAHRSAVKVRSLQAPSSEKNSADTIVRGLGTYFAVDEAAASAHAG